jgi:MarR family transcriptional regulator for hemolysin
MHAPPTEPLGLQLIDTAQLISRAFEDVLSAAGGSMPMWLVMVSLKGQRHGPHPELAAAAGVGDPPSADQVDHMATAGLVISTGDPGNPEGHVVQLTGVGEELFRRLLRAVVAFDARLRAGFTDREIAALGGALRQLRSNVTDEVTT